MKKGPLQKQLEAICSELFDEMGLPDEEKVVALETFLSQNDLYQVNFHFQIKCAVMEKPTILNVIKHLSLHSIDGPKKIIINKIPTLACYFELRDKDPDEVVREELLETQAELTLLRDTYSNPRLNELTRFMQIASAAYDSKDMSTLQEVRDTLVRRVNELKK